MGLGVNLDPIVEAMNRMADAMSRLAAVEEAKLERERTHG